MGPFETNYKCSLNFNPELPWWEWPLLTGKLKPFFSEMAVYLLLLTIWKIMDWKKKNMELLRQKKGPSAPLWCTIKGSWSHLWWKKEKRRITSSSGYEVHIKLWWQHSNNASVRVSPAALHLPPRQSPGRADVKWYEDSVFVGRPAPGLSLPVSAGQAGERGKKKTLQDFPNTCPRMAMHAHTLRTHTYRVSYRQRNAGSWAVK